MGRSRIANACKTTVLTESLAGIHDDHFLGRWVRDRTGDTEARYDLLSVRSLAGLDDFDLDVLADDVRTAVSLHGGERLLVYGRGDMDATVRGIERRLGDLRRRLKIEPYEIGPRDIPPELLAPSNAVVLTCMDWRLHGRKGGIAAIVKADMKSRRAVLGGVDVLTTAGCAKEIARGTARWCFVRSQIASYGALEPTVYLVSHVDCGKYGGSMAFRDADEQMARLKDDLRRAADALFVSGAVDIVPAIAVVNEETVTDLLTL